MTTISGGNALLNADLIINKIGLTAKMKVADLGCGSSGHFVIPMAKFIGKEGKMYAVDILKPALENVEKRAKYEALNNVFTVWSDLEMFKATKITSQSLDVACLINTLYQSGKRVNILREALRLLKKKGLLAIIEWKQNSSPFGPLPEERVKAESLKQAAQKLGLHLEKEFEAGEYHYGLVFIKM